MICDCWCETCIRSWVIDYDPDEGYPTCPWCGMYADAVERRWEQ